MLSARAVRTVGAILAIAGVAPAMTGCGLEPGSGQCRETTLVADPVVVTDPLAPLTLTARLTSEREPVAGANISFFTLTTRPADTPGGPSGGRNVGEATTGADGVARYLRDDGIDGLVLADEELTGYQADFTPLEKINGVQYCKARTDAPVTVTS